MRAAISLFAFFASCQFAVGCSELRENGADCLKGRDCESGFCRSGVCVPEPVENPTTTGPSTTSTGMGGAAGGAGGVGSGGAGQGGATGGAGGNAGGGGVGGTGGN